MLDGVRLVERLTDPDIAGDLPFGFLKYERLYREQIDDALDLVRQADAYRIESNTIRPRKALAWNRPSEVHQGPADSIPPPTFPNPKSRQPLDAGHCHEPIPSTGQTNDFVQREL